MGPDIIRADSMSCLETSVQLKHTEKSHHSSVSASLAGEYADMPRPCSRGTAAADRLMMMIGKEGGSRPQTTDGNVFPSKPKSTKRRVKRSNSSFSPRSVSS